MKVKAPSEKNFRRAKVKPGRAKRSRSRIGWKVARHVAALMLFCYASYRAVDLVVRAAPLQVGRIVVTGNVRLSSAEVQALTHGLYGRSILTADLDCLPAPPARVALGGGRSASSRPALDNRGTRRRATADWDQQAGESALSDRSIRHGDRRVRSAATASSICRSSMGSSGRRRRGKPAIDAERAELAARVIDSVSTRKAIARRLSQIDVSDLHDVVVLLEGDSALLHLGEERFVERLQSYLEVASALGIECRTSTTSTCGSTIACTSSRAALRARSRQANRRLVDSDLTAQAATVLTWKT